MLLADLTSNWGKDVGAVCKLLRAWAAIFALVSGGCAVPKKWLGDLLFAPRSWTTGEVKVSGKTIYAVNREGSAIIAVNPESLRWEETDPAERTVSIDADEKGIWRAERRAGEPVPRLLAAERLLLLPGEGIPRVAWTRRGALVRNPDARVWFFAKEGSASWVLPGLQSWDAVDYWRDRVWTWHKEELLSMGPEGGWRPAKLVGRGRTRSMPSLPRERDRLVFTRDRFVLLSEGLVWWGSPGEIALSVEGALEFPEAIREIALNAQDEETVVAFGKSASWSWNFALREGRRFPRIEPPVYVDSRSRRLVRWSTDRWVSRAWDGSDERAVTISLDPGSRVLNATWRILILPADIALLMAGLLTPLPCICECVGLGGWELAPIYPRRMWFGFW